MTESAVMKIFIERHNAPPFEVEIHFEKEIIAKILPRKSDFATRIPFYVQASAEEGAFYHINMLNMKTLTPHRIVFNSATDQIHGVASVDLDDKNSVFIN